ncbi:MAG: MFS transporter [Candidatus Dormibacteraeota bacterium]|uniref:MFS transporter n=1 Tax=Candidatus Amunia macphersoniae TaxID=3127014 RepID=A0A934KPV9_9BACT|nr:MFS transporter [Candidatus Dormibacteraeota bacterium]
MDSQTTLPHAPDSGPGSVEVPTASADEQAVAASLERDLVQSRPTTIRALLAGTVLLRIGTSGAAVAIGFDLVDMFGGRPNGLVVGFIGASQAIPEMVFAPILARFADRFGRRLFLVGGPLVSVLGAILLSLATRPEAIVVARLIEGVGAACFVPTALGTIAAATSHSRQVRATASGAFEAANLAGYAGGFVVGPFAYHWLQHGAFLVLAGLYLCAALVCAALVPYVPPLPVSRLSAVFGAVLGPGPIRSFLPAWMACFALLGAYAAHLPALLRRSAIAGQTVVHHFDERIVSAILVSWIALLLVGIALWTPWIPKLGAVRTMRRAAPGAWLISAAVLALDHTPGFLAPFFLFLVIVGIVVLAGFGPAAVTYLAECSETFVADRSALMAFYTVALAGGGAIGSVLGGVAVRLDYADGLVILGLLLSMFAYVALTPVLRYERALARALDSAGASVPRV